MKYLKAIPILLLLLNNSFSQWITLSSGTGVNLKSVFFTSVSTGYVSGSGGVILKTTNAGLNWSPLSSGLSSDINSICFYNSSTGLACGNSGNIIITVNSGLNWNPVSSGVTANLYAISFSGTGNGVCTGSDGTLMFTSNGGLNWVIAVNGFLSTYYGINMASSSTAFAGGVNTIFQPLVAKTTNSGANWSYSTFYLNSNEGNLRDMYFISAAEGFAVSNVWNGQGGISYTSNGGLNWTTQLFTSALNGIDFAGFNTAYAVGINGYIIKTTSTGASWLPQASGVSAILRSVDFVDSINGYAAGDGGVILKTTNGGVTAIHPVSNEIPSQYSLSQNYPNPFNPVTKIRFQIPLLRGVDAEGGRGVSTKLLIYDILGREIAALVNEQLNPGIYEVDWNASNYPSGVYYYRLSSGDYLETMKMALIK